MKNVRLPQVCPCYFSRVSQTCRTVERERSCGRQSQHGLLRHRARPVRTGFAAKLGLTKADTMWKEASSWFVGHNNVLQNTSLAHVPCASVCRCLLCLVWPSQGVSLACKERWAQPLASPSSCFRQCCSRAIIFQPVAMRTRGAHGPEQQHSTKRTHAEDTNSPVLAQQTEHEARL